MTHLPIFLLQLSLRESVFLPLRRLLTCTTSSPPLFFFVFQLPSSVFLSPVLCSQLPTSHLPLCHARFLQLTSGSRPAFSPLCLHPSADKTGFWLCRHALLCLCGATGWQCFRAFRRSGCLFRHKQGPVSRQALLQCSEMEC